MGEPDETGGATPPDDSADSAPNWQRMPHDQDELPPAEFSAFILSLAQSIMIDLGVAPHPDSGSRTKNLIQARHTIETLGMLREKTRGNLTDEEQKLFKGVMYQVRISYVEAESTG